mmetsp:Transcript_31464/g.82547  ORF Transcript_31464/g.82547 Transcript_31464/m.82547 type:complete len:87 (+) Transcript_31464:689-949(+)
MRLCGPVSLDARGAVSATRMPRENVFSSARLGNDFLQPQCWCGGIAANFTCFTLDQLLRADAPTCSANLLFPLHPQTLGSAPADLV